MLGRCRSDPDGECRRKSVAECVSSQRAYVRKARSSVDHFERSRLEMRQSLRRGFTLAALASFSLLA
jgi:hypothetical protein